MVSQGGGDRSRCGFTDHLKALGRIGDLLRKGEVLLSLLFPSPCNLTLCLSSHSSLFLLSKVTARLVELRTTIEAGDILKHGVLGAVSLGEEGGRGEEKKMVALEGRSGNEHAEGIREERKKGRGPISLVSLPHSLFLVSWPHSSFLASIPTHPP